jgi:hypothetical protein
LAYLLVGSTFVLWGTALLTKDFVSGIMVLFTLSWSVLVCAFGLHYEHLLEYHKDELE